MKTIIALVLVGVLLAGCDGGKKEGGNASAWQTVTADDGSYTVSMPRMPKADFQSVDVPQGKINIKMQELITEGVNYTVGYSEYPPDFLASVGPDASVVFARAHDATVKKRQAKVVEDSDGRLGDFPSHTVVMTFAMPENFDNAIMKQVMILAKGRMYIAQSIVLSKAPADQRGRGEVPQFVWAKVN